MPRNNNSSQMKSSKKSNKKSKSSTEVTTESDVVHTPEPEVVLDTSTTQEHGEHDSSSTEEESWSEVWKRMEDREQQIVQLQKEQKTDRKLVYRIMNQEVKRLSKRTKQRGGNSDPNKPKKKPSGFAKPTHISSELESFLGVESGTMLARTDVTKRITNYIKEHNLQNPDNRREIRPDAKLGTILTLPEDKSPVTYFNLQRCIKTHFHKATESDSGIST